MSLVSKNFLCLHGNYLKVPYYRNIKNNKFVMYYPKNIYDEEHQYICETREEIYKIIKKLYNQEYYSKWYEKNKEKRNQQKREYRKDHKEEINQYKREYYKRKIKPIKDKKRQEKLEQRYEELADYIEKNGF